MGCRIIEGKEAGTDVPCAVLFCSTSGIAFGPLFDDHDEAQDFLEWLAKQTNVDARNLTDKRLHAYIFRFRKEALDAEAREAS